MIQEGVYFANVTRLMLLDRATGMQRVVTAISRHCDHGGFVPIEITRYNICKERFSTTREVLQR
jgi:hypothetical protein